jgi:hypothetical protein
MSKAIDRMTNDDFPDRVRGSSTGNLRFRHRVDFMQIDGDHYSVRTYVFST